MNKYVTGTVIKELREKMNMTQADLAEKLMVSDKAVSKWETGRGYPDISLLEPLSKIFGVSITELISGNAVTNINISANKMRSKYYVCPICGNIIHCMGEAVINCHGLTLSPLEAEAAHENHMVEIEKVEDEYYVRVNHPMTKTHYISFIAAVGADRIQTVKLYPEGASEGRFKINSVRNIFYCCNRDGLFKVKVIKGIHDKEKSYSR
jgi:transcriptional regulator with XRE-family HTH domain/desulfoferrodoxin (superoxide reductase-like protein)